MQGVSYRYCTHIEALKIGLTGFVKNLHTGDVYIEAEGTDEQINKLIDWCYVGSPLAKVTEVMLEEADLKDFKNFEIKR